MSICRSDNIGRSIEPFSDLEVGSDVISQLISQGSKATASRNEAWSFAVISDKHEIKRLSDELKKYLLNNLEQYPYFKQYGNSICNENYNIFFNAPCLLFIYGDANPRCNVYNCTLAAGNIMQDAIDYDLRTCWIGFTEHVCDTEEFKSRHKIPKPYKLVCAMSVGYPKGEMSPPSCLPVKVLLNET